MHSDRAAEEGGNRWRWQFAMQQAPNATNSGCYPAAARGVRHDAASCHMVAGRLVFSPRLPSIQIGCFLCLRRLVSE